MNVFFYFFQDQKSDKRVSGSSTNQDPRVGS